MDFPRKIDCAAFVFLLLWAVPCPALAAPYQTKVIKVTDGDSLEVLVRGAPVRIRLSEIDCPEYDQPWGDRAKQALSQLVFLRVVTIHPVTQDRYGRTVATVFLEGRNVNHEMVQRGHCHVYRKYVRDERFYGLEKEARGSRRGLWALPESERVPPWQWKREKWGRDR